MLLWWLSAVAAANDAYRRARKDGLWDADCQAAYEAIRARHVTVTEEARSGDGVVLSAAGDLDFVRREVLRAGQRLRTFDVSTILFVERDIHLRELDALFDRIVETDVGAGPVGFRVKAAKIAAMARSPFMRTIYLDFDSVPCRADFAVRLLATLGDADVALADNYAEQDPGDLKREHASGCVVLRSNARTRRLLSLYAAAHAELKGTTRGRRDQPALMVALRVSVEDHGLTINHIPHDVFCRKNTSQAVSCDAGCVVAHKPDRYDLAAKVFGIGVKKTGTTSLAAALARLRIGPEPPHARSVAATRALLERDDPAPAVALAAHARAFADAPWCMAASKPDFLNQLATAYPRAKFVLTLRDPRAWWTSTRDWLACLKPYNAQRYAAMLGAANLSKSELLRAYHDYNTYVQDYFRACCPERLLVLALDSSKNGLQTFPWTTLCDFVQAHWRACPTRASPNSANSFLQNDLAQRHPDAVPPASDLAACAATLTDDDAALITALQRHSAGTSSQHAANLAMLRQKKERSRRSKPASPPRRRRRRLSWDVELLRTPLRDTPHHNETQLLRPR